LHIKNYLNWLQNNHGTIKNCPIDVIKDTSRESFEHFLSMDPEERGGKDDGTVWYDVKAARESEEFNKIGAFAPTVAPVVPTQSGRTSITSSTKSPEEAELAAFEKKLSFSDSQLPTLDTKINFTKWCVQAIVYFKLKKVADLLDPQYTAPNSSSPQAAQDLHDLKNTFIFQALLTCVQSGPGVSIVKQHDDSADGITVWKELLAHYTTDVVATTNCSYYMNLITREHIPPPDELKKGLAEYIVDFKSWVGDYNAFCPVGQELSPDIQLLHFTNFIENATALSSMKDMMDLNEILPWVLKLGSMMLRRG
jgi:hypothetical protein